MRLPPQVGCKLLVAYSVSWKEGYRPTPEESAEETGLKLQILHLGLHGRPGGAPPPAPGGGRQAG